MENYAPFELVFKFFEIIILRCFELRIFILSYTEWRNLLFKFFPLYPYHVQT